MTREPTHRLTQTFRDAKLERAYLDHAAQSSLRTWRVLSVLVLAGIAAAYASDRTSFGPANEAVIHRVRELVMFPVAGALFLFGFAPAAWFRRGWRLAVSITAVNVIVSPTLTCIFLADPAQFDVASGYISVVCVMVAAAVILPIGFPYVFGTTVVNLATLIALAYAWHEYTRAATGWLWFAALLTLLSAYQVNLRDRLAFAAQYRLDDERARSERLLRNVLPAPIAERLKAGETRLADRFEHATVLFADLVGFTPLAARLAPEQLVAALDEVFSAFDDIAARHGLEKIKTIGDAYLVVGGVPTPRTDHAEAVAQMALEMRAWIASRHFHGEKLELRIGLHSGPLVAGVIGKQKFIYDLWGDTVNTASRMESSGLAGSIQVTGATEALLRARFALASRGTISVKGKGELETWLLEGPRAAP